MIKQEIKKTDALIERDLHLAFMIGILLKGLNAAVEVLLGLLLLYTHVVTNVILSLMDKALVEDPDNFFATHLYQYADPSPQAQFYGGLYLLSHGVVKVLLVGGLLRKKIWAYPASIAVLALFMVYQLIRFIETHSIAMLLLTLFDGALVYLIWHEYRRVRDKHIRTKA
ncbi:DUF2127 domain-containing protein [Candidatus Kaiserbacteria bacterium]|nr:DUF2127 domain-containing protein [Candidatus Kaiserbacteria bacterium]